MVILFSNPKRGSKSVTFLISSSFGKQVSEGLSLSVSERVSQFVLLISCSVIQVFIGQLQWLGCKLFFADQFQGQSISWKCNQPVREFSQSAIHSVSQSFKLRVIQSPYQSPSQYSSESFSESVHLFVSLSIFPLDALNVILSVRQTDHQMIHNCL